MRSCSIQTDDYMPERASMANCEYCDVKIEHGTKCDNCIIDQLIPIVVKHITSQFADELFDASGFRKDAKKVL